MQKIKDMKSCKKGVILLSGGIDSAVVFYYAKKNRYQLTALIFDYNQRHKREIDSARKISGLNKVKFYIVKTNFPWTKSSLTDKRIKVSFNRNLNTKKIPLSYVAGRNIIFLSYALSAAESIGAKCVFIGVHTQDFSGYPDCRPQFLEKFQNMANSGMKNRNIKIIAPLIGKSKKEIIKMGIEFGVPFKYTWSCYQGADFPCRKCDSCRFRIKAFQELKLTDPLMENKGRYVI